MYNFFSLSNGGEYITSEQLQRKILAIDRNESISKSTESDEGSSCANGELMHDYEETSDSDEEIDWSQRSDSSNEKLTEDQLVSAAVDYTHGNLPIVNQVLCLSDPHLEALDHIPFLYRSILHPLLSLKILYFKLIKFLGRKTLPIIFPFVKSEFQFLILMFVYMCMSNENVFYLVPILIYYISFIVMISTTFKMLQSQRDFVDFRLWSGLFICYSGGSLNAEESEQLYIRNNLKPYGHFFVALLINLMIYPIISEQWIAQSELTIVAFLLTFMTLLGFMPKRRGKTVFDTLVLFSFAVNVLAKYPYDTDPVVAQDWRFLELKIPTFPSYVIGNGIEFCINFKFILYALIPVIFAKIACRQNWRGTYKVLIPHCVTLSWLQICIISSQGATMFGFLRGTLAMVGVVLFLPLVGITSVVVPILALSKYIITSNVLCTFCIFLAFCMMTLGVLYLRAGTRYNQYTATFQISLMVLGLFLLINTHLQESREEYYDEHKTPQIISWEVYQRFCHQPVWQEENVAISQMKCAELEGGMIHWNGYISDVKVKSIKNTYKSVFDRLPSGLAQYFYCLYGEEIKSDCTNVPEIVRDDCISFYDTINSINHCSLQKHNVYTFEMKLKMQSGIWGKATEVSLIANHYFEAFILKLKPTDYIWFKGYLYNNQEVGSEGILGGLSPHVNLEELGCISCHDERLTEFKNTSQNKFKIHKIVDALYVGFKFILNVVLNPVIVIK